MKGIKVVDVGCNPEETQFGTCELCFSYGVADNPYITLEFPNGEQVTHDTYYWDWGDYHEYNVYNIVDFSAWLSEYDFTEEEVSRLKDETSSLILNLIEEYNNELVKEYFEVEE